MKRRKMNRRILFVWMGRQEMKGKEEFFTCHLHEIRGNNYKELRPHGAKRGIDWTAGVNFEAKRYITPKLGACVEVVFLTHVKINDGVEEDCRFGRCQRVRCGDWPIMPLPMGRENIPDLVRFQLFGFDSLCFV